MKQFFSASSEVLVSFDRVIDVIGCLGRSILCTKMLVSLMTGVGIFRLKFERRPHKKGVFPAQKYTMFDYVWAFLIRLDYV